MSTHRKRYNGNGFITLILPFDKNPERNVASDPSASAFHKLPCAPVRLPLLRVSNKIGIEGQPGERPAVADDYQLLTCPGHGYVHPADIGQEADLVVGIAPRQPDVNDVAL